MTGRARAALAALSLVAGLPVLGAVPALASANPPIVVTTTTDGVNAPGGPVSLRDAVAKADTDPGADSIVLAAGASYDLTICGGVPGGIDNSTGDLDATDPAGLTIVGAGATIHQTCPQRVIDASAGQLTMGQVSLVGGTATSGASIWAASALTLDQVDVSGANGGSGGAVVYSSGSGGVFSLTDTAVHDNTGTGIEQETGAANPSFAGTRLSVRNNTTASGPAGGVWWPGPVTLDQAEIKDNSTGLDGSNAVGGVFSYQALVTGSVISGNTGVGEGGIHGGFHLVDSVVSNNTSKRYGGGGDGAFVIEGSTVSDNRSGFFGGGLSGSGTVSRSTISGNVSADPVTNAPRFGGGIATDGSHGPPTTPDLQIVDSTITGNSGLNGAGVAVWDDFGTSPVLPTSVSIESSTIAGNTAPGTPTAADAVDLGVSWAPGEPTTNVVANLSLSGSVIGGASITTPVCSVGAATVTSGGYNVAPDGSCGLGAGVGDVAAGGDPGLSPLGAHGGTTETMVPTVGSPLIDAIPTASPLCTGTDQRGVARPTPPGGRCDVGAVESDSTVFPEGSFFTPIAPVRLVDSRPASQVGPYATPWAVNATRDITVDGSGTPVPAGAAAVVLNVTVTDTTSSGFLTLWPTGRPRPMASSLNWAPGQTIPNQVTAKVGANGKVSVFTSGAADIVVDVVGYYGPGSVDGFASVAPARLLDSRASSQVGPFSTPWAPAQTRVITVTGPGTPVPVGTDAVVLNVTVTDTAGTGFLTVWPGGTRPTASSLNWSPGQTIPNAVTTKVDATGTVDVYASGSADVVIDVAGYFTAGSGAAFRAVTPTRVLDSRPGSQVGPYNSPFLAGGPRPVTVAGAPVAVVPANAPAVLTNTTVTDTTGDSFLTVWPNGGAFPPSSSLNWRAGVTIANAVTAVTGSAGQVLIRNNVATADVVVDVGGWYG